MSAHPIIRVTDSSRRNFVCSAMQGPMPKRWLGLMRIRIRKFRRFCADGSRGAHMRAEIITGDCRMALARHGPFDLLIADPPYGDTSLDWDKRVDGWLQTARAMLKPTGSLWVFGSMRFFIDSGHLMRDAGFRLAQDIVWEKHNGSAFHADRFKRVHEHAVQFYNVNAKWTDIYNEVQKTGDATARTVRRKRRPSHTGHIEASAYASEDGGPRIMRSVIFMPSCHGRAIHPTEKPDALLEILIRTSCPADGLVGDLFAGSGSAGEASRRAGRDYVGTEIDPIMAQKARDRLSGQLALVSHAEIPLPLSRHIAATFYPHSQSQPERAA